MFTEIPYMFTDQPYMFTEIPYMFTDQPYIFTEIGVLPSVDSHSKHNIVHGKLNFKSNIPLLMENDVFISNFLHKADILNDFFASQCTIDDNGRNFTRTNIQDR